jgi:hypothetical protein
LPCFKFFGVNVLILTGTPILPDSYRDSNKELFWECKSRGNVWNKKEKRLGEEVKDDWLLLENN